jgi:hypothetical protein
MIAASAFASFSLVYLLSSTPRPIINTLPSPLSFPACSFSDFHLPEPLHLLGVLGAEFYFFPASFSLRADNCIHPMDEEDDIKKKCRYHSNGCDFSVPKTDVNRMGGHVGKCKFNPQRLEPVINDAPPVAESKKRSREEGGERKDDVKDIEYPDYFADHDVRSDSVQDDNYCSEFDDDDELEGGDGDLEDTDADYKSDYSVCDEEDIAPPTGKDVPHVLDRYVPLGGELFLNPKDQFVIARDYVTADLPLCDDPRMFYDAVDAFHSEEEYLLPELGDLERDQVSGVVAEHIGQRLLRNESRLSSQPSSGWWISEVGREWVELAVDRRE